MVFHLATFKELWITTDCSSLVSTDKTTEVMFMIFSSCQHRPKNLKWYLGLSPSTSHTLADSSISTASASPRSLGRVPHRPCLRRGEGVIQSGSAWELTTHAPSWRARVDVSWKRPERLETRPSYRGASLMKEICGAGVGHLFFALALRTSLSYR